MGSITKLACLGLYWKIEILYLKRTFEKKFHFYVFFLNMKKKPKKNFWIFLSNIFIFILHNFLCTKNIFLNSLTQSQTASKNLVP
jgi:hypothetical protein